MKTTLHKIACLVFIAALLSVVSIHAIAAKHISAEMTKLETTPKKEGSVILKLSGSSMQSSLAACNAFQSDYPNVQIVYNDDNLNVSDTIIEAMLANDHTIDIYAMEVSSGLWALKEKSYLADLSTSLVLSSTISTYYQSVQDILMYDQQIVAFPEYFYPYLWAVNKDLWDDLSMPDLPQTYSEYIQLIMDWKQIHPENQDYILMESSTSRKTLMAGMIRSYILQNERPNALLSFDSADFRASCEAIFKMPDVSKEEDEANYLSDKPILLTEFSPPMGYEKWPGSPSTYILPPKVSKGDQHAVFAQMKVLFVNPNSLNKEYAIKYLEYVAKYINPVYTMQFNPKENTPIPSDYQRQVAEGFRIQIDELKQKIQLAKAEDKKELEQALQNAQTLYQYASEQYLVSPSDIAAYRAAAPYITFGEQSLFLGYNNSTAYHAMLDAANRYLNNKLSLDQMISALDQISKLAFYER